MPHKQHLSLGCFIVAPLNREIGVDIAPRLWYHDVMECRIVLTMADRVQTEVGMYDPQSGRYEPLGQHGPTVIDKVVRDLKERMEREGHKVSFCTRAK